MAGNDESRKAWAVSGITCAALCIVAVLSLIVYVFVNQGYSDGLRGVVIPLAKLATVIGVSVVGVLGTIFSVIAAVRHESRKAVLVGLSINIGILFCSGMFYLFEFYYPIERIAQEQKQKSAHYFATRTPQRHLFDAIRHKNIKELKALQDQGVDSNAINKNGRSALHYAISTSTPEIVESLLNHGAIDDPQRPLALHLAASFGNLDMLKLLVEYGWDPNLRIDYFLNGKLVSPLDIVISASKTGRNKEPEIRYLLSLTGAEQDTTTDARSSRR